MIIKMSYPSIKSDDFYDDLTDKYYKYKISKKKKTFDQVCFPKNFVLQPSQKFLAEYINPKTPYTGVLVFHKIGSGKTCTAIRIGEAWKKERKILVLVPASLTGNFRDELRSLCVGNTYLKNSERKKLSVLHPSSPEYRKIIAISDKRINDHYQILSYHKFINLYDQGKISFRNKLLIVDEIQNMVSVGGRFYETLYEAIHEAPKSLRTVLLSATPMFDKPIEIALTMNLLRIPNEFPTGKEFEHKFINMVVNPKTGRISYTAKNLDNFKERIKGYISYYRGAPPYVFPEHKIKYVKCHMSEYQYKSYLTVERKEIRKFKKHALMKKFRAFQAGSILDLPNNFFTGTRTISNIVFPKREIGKDGYDLLKDHHLQLDKLSEYSCKFFAMLKRIKLAEGPVFVYSNFKGVGGLKSFVKVLETNGYVNYAKYGEGKKRFALFTGDENIRYKNEIKAVYNQPGNHDGSKLRMILGSMAIKEGISLLRCRQVHIMEPYWNISREMQIRGRALRTCAHKDLPIEKRNLIVYVYLATHSNLSETVDQYILTLAQHKDRLINEFETAMKEAAIDCQLFEHANTYEGEKKIKCE